MALYDLLHPNYIKMFGENPHRESYGMMTSHTVPGGQSGLCPRPSCEVLLLRGVWSWGVDGTCPHAFTEEKQMPGMSWNFQEKCLSLVQAPVG